MGGGKHNFEVGMGVKVINTLTELTCQLIRLEERWHYIACLAFFFLSIAYLQQQQTATRSNILASVLHNISSNKLTVT